MSFFILNLVIIPVNIKIFQILSIYAFSVELIRIKFNYARLFAYSPIILYTLSVSVSPVGMASTKI